MDRLRGKVAVVTGAARGIGRAVAVRLAEEGADVVVNYRADEESAGALVRELTGLGRRAVAVRADVSDPAQTGRLMDEAADRFGRLDVLVSNAGVEHFAPLAEITPEDFDRVFATNTRGQLFAAQHAARHLGPGGRILLMSSVSAHKAVFHHAVYAASKAAVEAIALNLAPELAQRGITINAIAPGGTKTDMAAAVSHRYRHPALDLDEPTQMRTMAALGRLATAQEIAAAAVFLVSPDAAYLTGATIPVNGGFF